MTIFKKYVRKPVIVEAVQWLPSNTSTQNVEAQLIVDEIIRTGGKAEYVRYLSEVWGTIVIDTLEGKMSASAGDWICRGLKGEYWPVKPDIFELTNELYDRDVKEIA